MMVVLDLLEVLIQGQILVKVEKEESSSFSITQKTEVLPPSALSSTTNLMCFPFNACFLMLTNRMIAVLNYNNVLHYISQSPTP